MKATNDTMSNVIKLPTHKWDETRCTVCGQPKHQPDPTDPIGRLMASVDLSEWAAHDIYEALGVDSFETLDVALAQAALRAKKAHRRSRRADAISRLKDSAFMGDAMAQRIHDELGVDSMETLVAAAFDGRLATVRGFGPKRLARMQEDLQDKIRSLYDDDRELLLAIRDALLAAGSVRRLRVAKDNLRRLRAYVRETIAERNEKREPLLSVVK